MNDELPVENIHEIMAELSELRKDKARIDWLEKHGVQSIYFHDGRQLNPASQSLRAAIDQSPDL